MKISYFTLVWRLQQEIKSYLVVVIATSNVGLPPVVRGRPRTFVSRTVAEVVAAWRCRRIAVLQQDAPFHLVHLLQVGDAVGAAALPAGVRGVPRGGGVPTLHRNLCDKTRYVQVFFCGVFVKKSKCVTLKGLNCLSVSAVPNLFYSRMAIVDR